MNTHKNSSNSFTPNPETNHQQNYLPYYNYQNFFPIFNQHASNSYFHNMNLLAGKPHLTPSSIGDPKKISSSFNEQSGINHPLQGTSMGFHGSFMDYLYHVENMRVAMIQHRKKMTHEVISLDSDEEQTQQKSTQVRTPQRGGNEQKIVVLDDQSQEKNDKTMKPTVPLASYFTHGRSEKLETTIQKNNSFEAKKKQLFEDLKSKKIQKLPKKSSKRSTIYESQKSRSQIIDQKYKIESYQKARKIKQKIIKSSVQQPKKKLDEGPVREIAKYMDSHGQIRHGREFQSEIPNSKILPISKFKQWLSQKRLSILKRQVGVLTY